MLLTCDYKRQVLTGLGALARVVILLAVVVGVSGCFAATPAPAPETATPTTSPSTATPAAAAMEPLPTATPTVTPRPPMATATLTATASPTLTPTPAASPVKLTATPTAAAATAASNLVAQPLSPPDGMVFTDLSGDTEILLTWKPVKPTLTTNEYYIVTLEYQQFGQTWTDRAETKDTRWLVNEHSYLRGLADDGLFTWSVLLVRQTGSDASGAPVEEPLSQPGESWAFVWQAGPVGASAAPPATSPPNTGDNNDNTDNNNDNDNDNDNSNSGGNDGSGGIGFPGYP